MDKSLACDPSGLHMGAHRQNQVLLQQKQEKDGLICEKEYWHKNKIKHKQKATDLKFIICLKTY